MTKDLTVNQKILAEFMSDISERCYGAGWLLNLEYILWDTLTSGPRKFGHSTISQNDIDQLNKYSDKAGSWIIYDDRNEEIGIELNKWKKKFKITVATNPEILNG